VERNSRDLGTGARAAILELLEKRGPEKTICPSDAARALAGDEFRPQMDTVRDAARKLVAEGRIEVTQGGDRVDLDAVKGPVRLRTARTNGAAGGCGQGRKGGDR
jgi:hypothetical protein